ncbi:hypothetical protein RJT34_01585 [Clitoria ternatea]|uniref:CCHC-type domain-containing protein n=1 Tax=Clitoria ternatea TaxID=43366 RepID=A0AAN9KIA1_CLITE
MSLATLFGKLQEHELELERLNQHEESNKKKKSIALKASLSTIEEDDEEDDEEGINDYNDLKLFVKQFNRFLKKKEGQRKPNFKNSFKNDESNQGPKCFECGEYGHMKMECPTLNKKSDKQEKKYPKNKRRAYISWDENDLSSSEESDHEETNLCLMANTEEVIDSNPTFDELQDAIEDLHNEYQKLAKKFLNIKSTNLSLKENLSKLNQELGQHETAGSSSCTTLGIEHHAITVEHHTITIKHYALIVIALSSWSFFHQR